MLCRNDKYKTCEYYHLLLYLSKKVKGIHQKKELLSTLSN